MSDLSVFLHKAADFFRRSGAASPDAQVAVVTAANKLTDAAVALEATVPVLAKAGADAALASLGPFGVAATPFANSFIDALIAELTSRKARPTYAVPAGAVAPPA